MLRVSGCTFLRSRATRPSLPTRRNSVLLVRAMETTKKRSSISLSRTLWEDSKREAFRSLYHPFVASIAAGTLELHSFQQFIAQDSFFLKAFAKAYGMAMENVDSPEIKSEIGKLQQAVFEELEMQTSLMKSWNFDDASSARLNPATSAYTGFLIAVASGKEARVPESKLATQTLAAMTPCMRLYAFLGQELKHLSWDKHPYHDWISTYSSADFEAAATRIEELLDKLYETLPVDSAALERLYHRAMEYEFGSFDAQDVGVRISHVRDQNIVLVSDFDSTCTVSDSCPVLAELAMVNNTEAKEKWSVLSDDYFRHYSIVLEEVLGVKYEYDYNRIKAALATLSEFEKQSNSTMVASGVFEGIKLDEIEQAGQKMALQPGCSTVLRRVSSKNSCQIISVCWSLTFIEAALSKENVRNVTIYSNELGIDGNITNGSLIRRVETPIDKEEVLLSKVLSIAVDKFVIYIGDSLTDLLCLLRADIGIVVGRSSNLDRAADTFGVKIVPLFTVAVEQQRRREVWKKDEGVLYRASGWQEIDAFLSQVFNV